MLEHNVDYSKLSYNEQEHYNKCVNCSYAINNASHNFNVGTKCECGYTILNDNSSTINSSSFSQTTSHNFSDSCIDINSQTSQGENVTNSSGIRPTVTMGCTAKIDGKIVVLLSVVLIALTIIEKS